MLIDNTLRFGVNDNVSGGRSAHRSGTTTPRLEHYGSTAAHHSRFAGVQSERLAALLESIGRKNKA